MKKQAKSFLAIALALTLGLGFSSCKKDEPDPGPDPQPTKETTFSNSLSLGTTLVEYYEITAEYTDADGKTTSVDFKQCPESIMKFITSDVKEDEVPVRTFTADCKTSKLPAETSIKLTYKYNGKTPADEVNIGVAGTFKIDGREVYPGYQQYMRGIDAEGLKGMTDILNEQFSNFIMKVDAKGNQSYILGTKKG